MTKPITAFRFGAGVNVMCCWLQLWQWPGFASWEGDFLLGNPQCSALAPGIPGLPPWPGTSCVGAKPARSGAGISAEQELTQPWAGAELLLSCAWVAATMLPLCPAASEERAQLGVTG